MLVIWQKKWEEERILWRKTRTLILYKTKKNLLYVITTHPLFSKQNRCSKKGMPAAYLSARTTCPRFVHAFLKILLNLIFLFSLCWLTAKKFSYNFSVFFFCLAIFTIKPLKNFKKNPSLAFYFIHVSSRYDIVVLKIYYDWNRLANKKTLFQFCLLSECFNMYVALL